ncbi:AMP-binding protein [Butyrivibrio sp. WCD3002]|uniref:AMP-binding protein n=1 Tax=Butyrivibrio sp. WCD3002 TaxID=1280676 RepID=UPI00042533D5|nr:AMP-binding protein [Butyrivibrio sp. WCD3002]
MIITDYLDEHAVTYSDKLAFSDGKTKVTYTELQKMARNMAGKIIEFDSNRRPIAILMGRCTECIVSIFGAIYSGNPYAVLNSATEIEYNIRIINILHPCLVITDEAGKKKLEEKNIDIPVMEYSDSVECKADSDKLRNRRNQILFSDPTYIIFTSGSTGEPKGVVTTYGAVNSFYEMAVREYGIKDTDVFANQYALHTVGPIEDIFYTVRCAATTYIIPSALFFAPGKLMKFLEEKQVTIINWLPSAMAIPVHYEALGEADLSGIRLVTFGGEEMHPSVLRAWMRALPQATFINAYGSTETTELVCRYIIDREFEDSEKIPMGVAYPNTRIYIRALGDSTFDNEGIGELCVLGDSLASGYYKNMELTERCFVQNPENNEYPEKMFCTGDLVSLDENNNLIYRGRKDQQIKRHGYRIELGEIENTAMTMGSIKECACTFNKETSYISFFYEGDISENEVMTTLKSIIPGYMLPDRVIRLEEMPHNEGGKIDRNELRKQSKG